MGILNDVRRIFLSPYSSCVIGLLVQTLTSARFAFANPPADCLPWLSSLPGTRVKELGPTQPPSERWRSSRADILGEPEPVQILLEVNDWQDFAKAASVEPNLPPALKAAITSGQPVTTEHLALVREWVHAHLGNRLQTHSRFRQQK